MDANHAKDYASQCNLDAAEMKMFKVSEETLPNGGSQKAGESDC
jgi:hypothetical protein